MDKEGMEGEEKRICRRGKGRKRKGELAVEGKER